MKLEITNQEKFDRCVESYRIIDNEVEITWTDQAMEDNKDRLQCKIEYFGPSEPAGEYLDFGFSIEMTKEDVLKYISDEIASNNSILFATIGQGGAGESLYSESSKAIGLSLEDALSDAVFNGIASEICIDLLESEFYNENSDVYEFEDSSNDNNSNPLRYQVVVFN